MKKNCQKVIMQRNKLFGLVDSHKIEVQLKNCIYKPMGTKFKGVATYIGRKKVCRHY